MRAIYLSPFSDLVRCRGAVQIHHPLQNCHGCRSKSKNHDKLINYTVRVMGQALFFCLGTRKLSGYTKYLSEYFLVVCIVVEIFLASARGRKILKFVCGSQSVSSFAILGLSSGWCELQMCLHLYHGSLFFESDFKVSEYCCEFSINKKIFPLFKNEEIT